MKNRLLVAAGLFALTTGLLAPLGTAAAEPGRASPDTSKPTLEELAANRYIVVMDRDPLVARFGQDRLRTANAKAAGEKLEAEQDAALKAVGKKPGDKTQSYTVALNGFATELSEKQADKMANLKSVDRVLPDVVRHKTTDASPKFLGLTGPGGVWAKGYTGERVVVGVIDTGIWPEHPSFKDDGTFPVSHAHMDPAEGNTCDFGNTKANPQDKPFTCNNKLVGARQMLDTYRSVVKTDPAEYDSARDDNGHGTHTASTSAGDSGVRASIFGIDRGKISGIAPRAQIIAYKGLGDQGGFDSDLAAAIDQAVEDGVDVINYSVGGGPSLTTPDDIAFLFAADAGVFVASSAGNSGPGAGTIGGPATVPWLTSVGASTQPRFFQGTVELGNGQRYTGASITKGTNRLPLVDAADAGGELCIGGTLKPSVVKGAIVLCKRGENGRAEKSLAVQEAGGLGMVLYQPDNEGNLFTDNHYVPSVHLDFTPGKKIKQYIANTARPTARLVGDQKSTWKSAPSMTDFSSRGPDTVAPDIIKPDVTAPGLQILAGASPTTDPGEGSPGQLFMAIAGTSMSSPHVAGAFALIKQAHPDWSAATAKSALMTTAYQKVVDNDRETQAGPFARGSGHIDLAGQQEDGTPFDPGLVYDAGFNDYLGFLCDADNSIFANPDAACSSLEGAGVPTEARNLNYPSIGVASVPGTETVKRTVTNVSTRRGVQRYDAKVKAPPGFSVKVSPSRLSLAPGEKATFTVALTNESAPVGAWRFGSLTWQGQHHDVYSPIAVKASLFDAPDEVKGTGDSGSVDIPIKFGYTGPYAAKAHGLVPADVTNSTVAKDQDQVFDPNDGHSDVIPISVNDAAHLRAVLPPDGVQDPDATDLDLYLYDPSGNQVASSTNGGTDEQIDVDSPANGTWKLYVHGWQTATSAPEPYRLYRWLVPDAAGGGNLSITSAPASATSGAEETVTAGWTGAGGVWSLGAVSHNRDDERLGLTLVDVDNR
jgi:subtilisin family serine protease